MNIQSALELNVCMYFDVPVYVSTHTHIYMYMRVVSESGASSAYHSHHPDLSWI